MPARSNQRIDARSQELTKNLVQTRTHLENHFKSIKRREVDFKKQKLMNFEEELKATARMARAPALEANGDGLGARTRAASPNRESRTGPLQRPTQRQLSHSRTWSGLGSGAGASASGQVAGGLSRCWSTPDAFSLTAAPQFPVEWGGHGVMPKPPGCPAASPLAVTRLCADTPAAMHPPPHPGAMSLDPHVTRSLKAFGTSHTASIYSPSAPPMQMLPRSPSTPPPLGRTSLLPPPRRMPHVPISRENDEDVTQLPTESLSDKDPMIKRLGQFMALLGPRYKCVNKDMIWEKAERGERTPAQRRLHKLGGIEAVGGGPDRLRPSGSAPGELCLPTDADGKARAAWLDARSSERERRNRNARSSAAIMR